MRRLSCFPRSQRTNGGRLAETEGNAVGFAQERQLATGRSLGHGAVRRAVGALGRGAVAGLFLGLPSLGQSAAAAEPPLPTAATPTQEAHAQAVQLHKRAEGALAAADWQTACPLYEASQALDPSATTQGRIAQCLEHEGKLASALRAYEQALRLVPKLDEARRPLAAERFPRYIAELEPRVPQLALRVARQLDAAKIRLDGVLLGQTELDAPLRVDPGSYVVAVEATGFLAQDCVLQASEAARIEVRIEPSHAETSGAPSDAGCQRISDAVFLISLAAPATAAVGSGAAVVAGPDAPTPLSPAAPVIGAPAAGTEDRSRAEAASVQRTLGYTLGGVGIASLALASYFGIRTLALVNDADCDANHECSPEGVKTMQDAERSQTAGFVAGGVGALLIGGGLALLLSSPAQAPSSASAGHGAPVAFGIASDGLWMKAIW